MHLNGELDRRIGHSSVANTGELKSQWMRWLAKAIHSNLQTVEFACRFSIPRIDSKTLSTSLLTSTCLQTSSVSETPSPTLCVMSIGTKPGWDAANPGECSGRPCKIQPQYYQLPSLVLCKHLCWLPWNDHHKYKQQHWKAWQLIHNSVLGEHVFSQMHSNVCTIKAKVQFNDIFVFNADLSTIQPNLSV